MKLARPTERGPEKWSNCMDNSGYGPLCYGTSANVDVIGYFLLGKVHSTLPRQSRNFLRRVCVFISKADHRLPSPAFSPGKSRDTSMWGALFLHWTIFPIIIIVTVITILLLLFLLCFLLPFFFSSSSSSLLFYFILFFACITSSRNLYWTPRVAIFKKCHLF